MRLVRLLVTLTMMVTVTLTPVRGWCQRAPASALPTRGSPAHGSLTHGSLTRGSPDLVAAVIANYAAVADRDTSTLRRALVDDFRWVLATGGQVMTKAQLLSALSRAPSGAVVTYDVDSAHVEVVGSVAMIDYRLTDRRRFGSYVRALVSRGTDTFVERDGRWRLTRRTQTWIVAPPATIRMDSAALRAFVGRYEHGAGYIDDVHLERGQLVATSSAESASGLPGASLLPVSDDAFSPDGVAPLIVFERDAGGRVLGYVQQSPDGSVVRARRLPDAPDRLGAAGLKHLPGR